MTKRKSGKGSGGMRSESVRVKSARGRKTSSTRWLQRQLNDPYVQRAKAEGYRSRAAFKILEIDEKFKLFKPGQKVIDLGAAPGGWTQIAAERVTANGAKGHVIGLDLLEIDPLPQATLIQMDFNDEQAPEKLKELLQGEADGVISDLAPNTTGHTSTDHLRIMSLVELAFIFACEVLSEGGYFVAKVWQGGTEHELLHEMKRRFRTVKHFKPKSSRQDSAEMFVVATGFRGGEV